VKIGLVDTEMALLIVKKEEITDGKTYSPVGRFAERAKIWGISGHWNCTMMVAFEWQGMTSYYCSTVTVGSRATTAESAEPLNPRKGTSWAYSELLLQATWLKSSTTQYYITY